MEKNRKMRRVLLKSREGIREELRLDKIESI